MPRGPLARRGPLLYGRDVPGKFALSILAAAAIALLACGSSSAPAVDPAATPSASLTLAAKDLHFNNRGLVVPAASSIKITLDNEDNGVKHNFALYTNKKASEKVFVGELFDGKKAMEYSFQAPAAGTYFFRCDSHPDTMTGTLVAK